MVYLLAVVINGNKYFYTLNKGFRIHSEIVAFFITISIFQI